MAENNISGPALATVCHDDEDARPWYMSDDNRNRIDFKKVGEAVIETFESQNHRIHTMEDDKEVFMYNDGVYTPRAEGSIERMTQDFLEGHTSEYNKNNVLGYVKTHTTISRSLFNKDGFKINLKNCVYNIMTDEHKKTTADDLFTYQLPIEYNVNAKCPNINEFFERILPTKDIRTVQEEISYCFVPGYPIQAMFWWIGEGANGKGAVFRLMERLLNKKNMSFSSIHDLETNQDYCRAQLFGKRANVSGDMSQKDLRKTNMIKMLTGEDTFEVRKIRKEPFEMMNEAKMFFAMNKIPIIDDDTDGFWRRPLPTEFNVLITEEEKHDFDEADIHTDEEVSGFFNCLMQHVKVILKNKAFTNAPSVDDVRDSIVETESIELFFKTHVEQVDGEKYEKGELYADYVEFSNNMNMVPRLRNSFFKYLKTDMLMDAKQRMDEVTKLKKRYFLGYRNRIKALASA